MCAALVWSAVSERLFREALTVTSLVTAGALPVALAGTWFRG